MGVSWSKQRKKGRQQRRGSNTASDGAPLGGLPLFDPVPDQLLGRNEALWQLSVTVLGQVGAGKPGSGGQSGARAKDQSHELARQVSAALAAGA